jgi:hypothetical protein
VGWTDDCGWTADLIITLVLSTTLALFASASVGMNTVQTSMEIWYLELLSLFSDGQGRNRTRKWALLGRRATAPGGPRYVRLQSALLAGGRTRNDLNFMLSCY